MGPSSPDPTWDGVRWIGSLDTADLFDLPPRVPLVAADGYWVARFLVRQGRAVRGFVEAPITDGQVDRDHIIRRVELLPAPDVLGEVPLPPMTVAVTTRNRPANVAPLVTSLLAIDYPDFEILIVDNASDTSATLDAIAALNDPRVKAIREPRPGASRGRNAAILAARHEVVAFVDDDVVADPHWLHGVAQGFARRPDVGIVTGMVPSGELASPAQGYFEARIDWEVTTRPRVFSLDEPPADIPLFPFEVGAYGTGANFAIRRSLALELGGINEALGTGSPAGGGEDIDLFVRVLFGGHSLVYEPSSVVWHRHRRETAELEAQMRFYGRGFGAWITAVLLDSRSRPAAVRLIARALRRTRSVGSTSTTPAAGRAALSPVPVELPLDLAAMRRREILGMLSGPYWYTRSRLDRRSARPLRAR